MATTPDPTRIALVAFPGVRAFDVSVITEVWGVDRTDRGVPPFELRRTAAEPAPIALRGGLSSPRTAPSPGSPAPTSSSSPA